MKKSCLNCLLLLLAVSFLICSCQTSQGPDGSWTDRSDESVSAPEITMPETDGTTTAIAEEPLLDLIRSEQTDYTIIIPQNASETLETAVTEFKKAIRARTGISLKLNNDYLNPSKGVVEKETEILIGATNREASSRAAAGLKSKDYAVRIDGKQLVIVGGSDLAAITALTRFTTLLLQTNEGKDLSVFDSALFVWEDHYPIESLTIGQVPASNFRIVYPDGNVYLRRAAEDLKTAVSDSVGYDISVVSDKTETEVGKPEILIGDTNRGSDPVTSDQPVLLAANGNIRIAGNSVYRTVLGVDAFMESYLTGSGSIDVDVSAEQRLTVAEQPQYKVMSFNILAWTEEGDHKDVRVGIVEEMIRAELPDSIGFQEDNEEWIQLLVPALGDLYDYVGVWNETNQKIYNAVFYRKDKFELLEYKTLWLSDTPETESKYVNSTQNRTVTCATLKNRQTGEIYIHYNTHLDIDKDSAGKQLTVLQEITGKSAYPYVVTGDFNIELTWDLYRFMQKTWYDSRVVAQVPNTGNTIDFIMVVDSVVAEENVKITRPYVLKDEWEKGITNDQPYYISDHWPVCLTFRIHP